jgi:hypothetical protein
LIEYLEKIPLPVPLSTAIQPSISSCAIERTTVRSERLIARATSAIEGKQFSPWSLQWFARRSSTELSIGSSGPKSQTSAITLTLTKLSRALLQLIRSVSVP